MHSRGSADHVENTASSFLWILNDTSLLWFHVKLQHLWILEVSANTQLFSPWQFPHGSPQQIQWCVSATNKSWNLETSRNPDLHRLLHDWGTDKHTQLVKWNFIQISRKSQLSECHWNHRRLLELLGCLDFLQTAFPSMLDPFMTGRRTGCVWKLRNCNFWEGNLWVFNVEKFGDTSNKQTKGPSVEQKNNLKTYKVGNQKGKVEWLWKPHIHVEVLFTS